MTTHPQQSTDKTSSSWGTWEDLLLACAVNRHGLNNWDSVATELQTKTSLPHLLTTPQFCNHKYIDLKRRFKHHQSSDNNHNNNIPWLQHLRKLRVDELKQDLQRYDLSIHRLQLKVKRLEEEREQYLNNNNNINTEPETDPNHPNKSLNPRKSDEPDKSCARLLSGDESDRDNRSVNQSNSTGLSDKIGGGSGEGGELVKSEADPGRYGSDGDIACQDEGGTRESEATQLSSDVQSSASYGRTTLDFCMQKRKMGSGVDAKSEPLIGLLDVIRSHKNASLFERPLKLQEWSKYKEIVRQNVDMETIQTRLEQGSYSSCNLTFYRDLLLLFNNAIVFFPKSSLESSTAHQLRRFVSAHIPDSSQQPKPHLELETSHSLLHKQKPSAPILVCRKRTPVSVKQFPQTSDQQQSDDKKPTATTDINPSTERSTLLKLKTQETSIIITGTRSSRRNSNNSNPSSSNKKQSTATASGSKTASASADNQETSKTDNKKKTEASSASEKKKKKKSVVDFLKRIKKNSPVQTGKKNSKGVTEEPKRNNNTTKRGKESQSSDERKQRKDASPPKKNVGRPPKKADEITPVTGKRSREVVVTKQPSKRARR